MRVIPKAASVDPYERDGVPPLGLRNYWYPALRSRALGRTPRRVTMLGENIVLFWESGKLFALQDRCAHRGTRLSRGRCEFPGSGTITCPSHGWTYDGRTGQCRGKLMEGPEARFAPRMRVKAYRVEQCAGVIWVFVGDMDAVPLDEDLPEWLLRPKEWFAISSPVDYRCNWRALADNWSQDWHANYVHRHSPEFLLQPAPFARDAIVAELPNTKGVGYLDIGGIMEGDFPGLGKWPRNQWYRFMKPTGLGTAWFDPSASDVAKDGSKFLKQLRLPAQILIGRARRNYWLCQYLTPIDESTTRLFNINIFRRDSLFSELYDRIHYVLFRGWAHDRIFSGQDKRILDDWEIGPEMLSKTDRDVMAWRRYSVENARRPAPVAGAEARAQGS